MSPRRRDAKLAAEISDNLILVAPSRWTVRREGKRPLQRRRIERKSPRYLKLVHGLGAYLIVAALASGCALGLDAANYDRAPDDPRERDSAECKFEAKSRAGAPSPAGGLIGLAIYAQHRKEVYVACMRARGWEKSK